MTPIEKAVAQMGGQSETGRLFGVSTQAVHKWVGRGFAPAEHCPRIEQLTGIRCEELNGRVDWSLIRGTAPAPVDHAAELRRAISETRIVFESEPVAGDVLNYLESVLAAMAPIPAQTGTAGVGGASIAEETVTVAGTEPVAGGDWRAAYGRLRATYMDLAQRYDELEAEMAAMTSTAADQAATAMAAESAQLVINAEKTAARAAARAALDPLAVLSREVFSLSNKLQQPADLVVQLLVLAELRGQHADEARSGMPLTVVLS